MALALGIVGLPNVGKSTLFTTLTKKAVDVANYPFTTIEPNVGVVAVPDERLEKLAKLSKSAKVVPAVVEFVDIAGLVKGANKGEGLGNQFLAQIREVDAIVEVVRAFTDSGTIHVEGDINPLRDHEIIETELIFKDLETVAKRIETIGKETRAGVKGAAEREQILRKVTVALEAGKPARAVRGESEKENEILREVIAELSLLTAKPILVLVNADTPEAGSVTAAEFEAQGLPGVVVNLKEELAGASLSIQERRELGLGLSALDELIRKAYATLGLISFLTTGEDETRAWTVRRGMRAAQAAGAIHTDFEKNFIRADVVNWQNLLETGSWGEARSKGLLRSEGKEYIVQDGDVIEVKHGA